MDWQVAEDRVQWDGATDILPFSIADGTAQSLLDTVTRAGRDELTAVLENRSPYSSQFELNLEVASAMGAMGFTFAGTRVADNEGRTERLIGMLRETTEKQREMQRLTYLATRDELTGPSQPQRAAHRTCRWRSRGQGGKPALRLPGRLDRPAGHDQ